MVEEDIMEDMILSRKQRGERESEREYPSELKPETNPPKSNLELSKDCPDRKIEGVVLIIVIESLIIAPHTGNSTPIIGILQ
jgi:hypothetical protein